MTNNDSEIVFEANSGISEEEQREILAKINGITETNRRSLSEGADEDSKKNRFSAKKSGNLFPVAVNIAAAAALACGLAALFIFHGRTDAQVREGSRVYNTAERALIDEIRKETSSRIEAKENEISLISSKLAEVDAQLRGLHSDNQGLSAEQQAVQDRLLAVQNEYRSTLVSLSNERSQILEDSRAREANLQAQLETRTRELALSTAAIDLALGEMDHLSREQAQAAIVEAQMGALFANLNDEINAGRFDEAAETIKIMREFLNTPAFLSLRSIQARKELYTQTILSFETMIAEARRNQAGGAGLRDMEAEKAMAELQEKNAQLEQNLAEKDKTIDAFSSEGSGLARRLSDLETDSRSKDQRIASLETEVNRLAPANAQLNQTINARDQTIDTIQSIVQGRSIEDMTIGELSDSLARIQQAIGQ